MSGTSDETASAPIPQDPEEGSRYTGPRSIGALLAPVLRPTWRKRAPATVQIVADWHGIVGPAIARDTTPKRLSAGTLLISCNGPVAMELQHLSDALIARINTHVGNKVVQRLRFIQDGDESERPLPAPRPQPNPAALKVVEDKVGDLPEGPLRDALIALGRAVVTQR